MTIQINYTVSDIDTKHNRTTYMIQVLVDGKCTELDCRTFDTNGEFNKNVPAYFTNFYSKWALRTRKIENAVVTVTEGKWWE
jgi:hypothetical protein